MSCWGPANKLQDMQHQFTRKRKAKNRNKDYERFYFTAVQTGKQHYSQLFKPKNLNKIKKFLAQYFIEKQNPKLYFRL